MDDKLCEHANNKQVVFSVDVLYYTFPAIVQDLVSNPERRHLHVFHVPKYNQGNCFVKDGIAQADYTILSQTTTLSRWLD
jgi:hypothetical protein